MAINDNGTRDQYTATASQTVFPYTFEIFDKDDLAVEQNGSLLSEGTDYTVSGVGNDNGGNVTLTTGATAGDTITIYRDMTLQRLNDYQSNGDFLADDVNDDYDRIWAALQQIKTGSDLAIRAPLDDTALTSSTTELSDVNTRANKVLGFDNQGLLSYVNANIAAGDFKYFATVAAMQADDTLEVGDVVIIGEQANALFDVIAATTNNGVNILDGTASGVSLQERDSQGRINATKTYTVGSGADFSTLNEAIDYVGNKYRGYAQFSGGAPFKINIELQSGFVLAEQIFVFQQDLSFINITSVDAEVTITRSAISDSPTIDNWVSGYTPVFCAMRNAGLPTIDCLFSMDTTGTANGNRLGIFLHEACHGVVTRENGIKNCDGRGVEVSGSVFYGRETNFSGSLDAAYRISNGSFANIRQSNGSGSVRGLYCTAAYTVANDCDFSSCTEYAIHATGEAIVHAPDTASGTCDLSSAGIHSVFVEDGSKVNVTSADLSGASSDAINARSGANVVAIGANLGTPGSESISVQTRAEVIANGATGVEDVGCFTGGKVELTNATVSGSPTFTVADGSEIIANGTSGATFSQIANVSTEDGIIYADSTEGSTLTANAGEITVTAVYGHQADTEGAASTDTITTINGGFDGQILAFNQVSNVRDITWEDGTGNLDLAGDFTPGNNSSQLLLRKRGSTWYEISRSTN